MSNIHRQDIALAGNEITKSGKPLFVFALHHFFTLKWRQFNNSHGKINETKAAVLAGQERRI